MLFKGSLLWLCHFTNGHLLDDRSAPATHHKSDSRRPLPPFRNFGYWGRLHGLHEGNKILFFRSFQMFDDIILN